MIIAIDGPSGTGKSTIARRVADSLGYLYFDTGALYRLLALHLLQHHISLDEESKLYQALESFTFDVKIADHDYHYFLNENEVTEAIRQPKISEFASMISKVPKVREVLLPIQRSFAKRHSIVVEGRDIGTIVFPNAEVKIFLTATPEVRAERRYHQLKQKFPYQTFSYENILLEQKQRDHQDATRSIAPLKQADDAAFLDTTDLTIEEVVDKIISLAKTKV